VCISWNNKSFFDTIDARCNLEESRKSLYDEADDLREMWNFRMYWRESDVLSSDELCCSQCWTFFFYLCTFI